MSEAFAAFPEATQARALAVLRALARVGVADTRQLQEAAGLTRDPLRRLLDRLQAAQYLAPVRQRIVRTTGRGRSPQVWRLAPAGATLLRQQGHPDARPSRLRDPRAIAHALAMLDVALAAGDMPVVVDKPLRFQGGILRPDILLPGEPACLFEVEQDASPAILRRIVRSLRNKAAFFKAPESAAVSPTIRMLVALPEGTAYQRTLEVWMQALDILQESAGEVPFRLWAAPLPRFLDAPDWAEPPALDYWTPLAAGERPRGVPALTQAPEPPFFASHQDRLVLAAMLAALRQGDLQPARAKAPNTWLFENARIIYAASHDAEALTPLQLAAYPWGSLYLLRQYLHIMHPGLLALLNRKMRAGLPHMRWNTTVILHRMQTVVDAFLAYHGFRSDGPLLAYADTPPWERSGRRTFRVYVHLRDARLLQTGAVAVVPARDLIRLTERALAWVLTALFRYAPDLGLKAPPFW